MTQVGVFCFLQLQRLSNSFLPRKRPPAMSATPMPILALSVNLSSSERMRLTPVSFWHMVTFSNSFRCFTLKKSILAFHNFFRIFHELKNLAVGDIQVRSLHLQVMYCTYLFKSYIQNIGTYFICFIPNLIQCFRIMNYINARLFANLIEIYS